MKTKVQRFTGSAQNGNLGLKSKAEQISRQLRAWADSLQNSPIKGQRYLTEKTRLHAQRAREREEFLKELAELRKH